MSRSVLSRLRGAALAVLCAACGLLASHARATELPPGLAETVLIPWISQPTTMDWTPDGDLIIGTRWREIWIYRAGELLLAGTIEGSNLGERGIAALAVDPDYAVNDRIWVYYTGPQPARNRLSRFTIADDTITDETIVFEGPLLANTIHNGGCFVFAEDGTMFLGMGDDFQGAVTAQDLNDPRGKILHLKTDGSPADDNPWLDGASGHPLVWAYGFRNPFRCNLQPGSGNLFIGDVGAGAEEEVSIGVRGGNFGWPLVEGDKPPGVPGVFYPIHSYPHEVGSGAAVIGGDHAAAGDWAPEFSGDYFFADHALNRLYRARLDAAGFPLSVETWATDIDRPVFFAFGPDGALYYAALKQNQVRKIVFVGGTNKQPTATAVATPDNGPSPLAVHFDGSASIDPDDDPLTYLWEFGDRSTSTAAQPTKFYAMGVWFAKLTVADDHGGVSQAPAVRVVSGNSRPSVTITSPTSSLTYDAGQTIEYAGTSQDQEEGPLTCSHLGWTVLFHHAEHTHPFLGPIQGSCSGSFVTADSGEPSPDTWYEIRLDANDTGVPLGPAGVLTGTTSVEIHPNLGEFKLDTAPVPGLALTLDTQPISTPQTVTGVVNFKRSIGAVDPQLRPDGHTYRWLAWSDGGAKEHVIATPAGSAEYVATFGCDVIEPVEDLVVSPRGDGEVQLGWEALGDACLALSGVRYRIYAGSVELPATVPCDFPADPPYALVGSTSTEHFVYTPRAGELYFRVVGVGTDGLDGPVECSDSDGDGEVDGLDNCPKTANGDQLDGDGDGLGNACDNCPAQPNVGQSDFDQDGTGDACDSCPTDAANDLDQDQVCDSDDNCLGLSNPDQLNQDGDRFGDACDVCPLVTDPSQRDEDHDGAGNACDACTDSDGDGYGNPGFPKQSCPIDNCPDQANPLQADQDGDRVGDLCDPCTDPDGDGLGDPDLPASSCGADNCPAVFNPDQHDTDSDGVGDACDACPADGLNDGDGDGLCADSDNCDRAPNPAQEDVDHDGLGDVCDVCPDDDQNDADRDGLCADSDNCASVANVDQENDDADALGNACDNCPLVRNSAQIDGDLDGVGNACDDCVAIPDPAQSDFDGDATGDVCDLDDGLIYMQARTALRFDWQKEVGFEAWNLYRASLAVLSTTGEYTQAPGSNPLAAQWCGLAQAFVIDPTAPPSGEVALYFATGIGAGAEGDLGQDSAGLPRPNDHPCP